MSTDLYIAGYEAPPWQPTSDEVMALFAAAEREATPRAQDLAALEGYRTYLRTRFPEYLPAYIDSVVDPIVSHVLKLPEGERWVLPW